MIRFSRFTLIGILLIFVGCQSEKKPPLRVGFNPWPGYEFIYLADQLGYFKKRGLDIKLVELSSLGDVRRAYERGQIDIMGATLIELIQASTQSKEIPQVIYVPDYSNGADVVIGNGSIVSIEQLKGKRIGVEYQSLNIFLLVQALKSKGMNLEDVILVSAVQASMEQEFREQRVDAVVSYPPVSLAILENIESHVLFNSSEIPGQVVDILAASSSTVKHRRHELKKFLEAFGEAQQYFLDNKDVAAEILTERSNISVNEFKEIALSELKMNLISDQSSYFGQDGSLNDTIAYVAGVLESTGQLGKKVPLGKLLIDQPFSFGQ